ncbi:hypothetical protein EDB60_110165 [Vibrio crassostreae]|nr:hypothetical protein EDB60_110165 [Vibrio crassostreae]CAK3140264.1 hypothetical protein VCRA2120E331_90082 [Vibrio crassostreae]CAK3301966.1 hypothetical protein VCRA2122O339_190015 [Vibrio crassostreae]CAK3645474.1 hypothetical protein VCRA2127O345_90082 [Vibrio crassostreae]CAK3682353.1 hypothetical protein VCRA2122O338_90082 [Vibrio crassostreae]
MQEQNFYALIDRGGHINAALSSEQRLSSNLDHCAINTKPNDGMKNAMRWEPGNIVCYTCSNIYTFLGVRRSPI